MFVETTTNRGQKSADAYRIISEVAEELGVETHVLRFWESKFKQIEPLKRAGGRRYYRPRDIDLLKRIQHLLHAQGYTIKGVQKLLKQDKHLTDVVVGAHDFAADLAPTQQLNDNNNVHNLAQPVMHGALMSKEQKATLTHILAQLKSMRAKL